LKAFIGFNFFEETRCAPVRSPMLRRCHVTERISRLFKEIEPDEGFNETDLKALREILTPTEAKRCLETLNNLRTLDPAVAQARFRLACCTNSSRSARVRVRGNGYKDPVKGEGDTWKQNAKEHFIQNSLFGVDIQQQAIEICRLRLWLSLLVDYELGVNPFEAERSKFIAAIGHISQLPNLEMNFPARRQPPRLHLRPSRAARRHAAGRLHRRPWRSLRKRVSN